MTKLEYTFKTDLLFKKLFVEYPDLEQAINAYHSITASPEFREQERLWSKARHDEAQALSNAEERGEARANAKWQGVAEENERLRLQIAELKARQKT